MRARVTYRSELVKKRVSGSQYLFHHIQILFNDYIRWLSGVGFVVPETIVSYSDNMITFTQTRVIGGKTRDIGQVVAAIQKLDFSTYGLDANPNNFLGQDNIYFVDFFPFLIKDVRIISEQFNYNIADVYQRYFTISNVLLCLINRTFKLNPANARHALISARSTLLDGYGQLLPRDKLRLLRALRVGKSETIVSFSQFYKLSKGINSISSNDNSTLRDLLEKIT